MRITKISASLWTAQLLLSALFIFAGVAKLTMPAEALRGAIPLPVLFLRFIAVMELLGAAGLVLPGLLRLRRELTPLASIGLVIIMIGATVVTLLGGQVAAALMPFVVGLVAASVAYGRRDWLRRELAASRRGRRRTSKSSIGERARRVA